MASTQRPPMNSQWAFFVSFVSFVALYIYKKGVCIGYRGHGGYGQEYEINEFNEISSRFRPSPRIAVRMPLDLGFARSVSKPDTKLQNRQLAVGRSAALSLDGKEFALGYQSQRAAQRSQRGHLVGRVGQGAATAKGEGVNNPYHLRCAGTWRRCGYCQIGDPMTSIDHKGMSAAANVLAVTQAGHPTGQRLSGAAVLGGQLAQIGGPTV